MECDVATARTARHATTKVGLSEVPAQVVAGVRGEAPI